MCSLARAFDCHVHRRLSSIMLLVNFCSFYQGPVPADGGYVWTASSNAGKQVTSKSQENSCTGNRKRDIRQRNRETEH